MWGRTYDTSITACESEVLHNGSWAQGRESVISMGILVNKYFSKSNGVLRCRKASAFAKSCSLMFF